MSRGGSERSGFGGLDVEWSYRWWIWYEFGDYDEWDLVSMKGGHACIVLMHMGRKKEQFMVTE